LVINSTWPLVVKWGSLPSGFAKIRETVEGICQEIQQPLPDPNTDALTGL
jgi:hypothetical protein